MNKVVSCLSFAIAALFLQSWSALGAVTANTVFTRNAVVKSEVDRSQAFITPSSGVNGIEVTEDEDVTFSVDESLIPRGCEVKFWTWDTKSDATSRYFVNNLRYKKGYLKSSDLSYTWSFNSALGGEAFLGVGIDYLSYSISYDGNGATGGAMGQVTSLLYTKSYTLKANAFTRTGYDFAGWEVRDPDSGEELVTLEDEGTVTGESFPAEILNYASKSVVLYAKWTPHTYTVTFDANGGEGSMDDQDFAYGEAQSLRANGFALAGYDFAGWATTRSGVALYGDGETVVNLTALDGDIIKLYAVWTVAPTTSLTVSFDAQGGTVTPTWKKCTKGGTYGDLPTPTRSGYAFDGWWTAVSGGVRVEASTLVTSTGAQTLFARWVAHTYTVRFDANGGSGTMADQAFTYGQGQTLNKNRFTRSGGYAFAGWATYPRGTVDFADQALVSNLTPTDCAVVTLYAVWESVATRLTVTFDAQGGAASSTWKECTVGETYGELPTPTRAGYAFDGWWTTATGGERVTDTTVVALAGTATVYAHWVANTYTVTFDANGGSGTMADQAFTYGQGQTLNKNRFSRSHCSFLGWSAETTGPVDFTDQALVSNLTPTDCAVVTLYAVWESVATRLTVTFNAQGGTVTPAWKECSVGEAYGELPMPTRAGYTFDGWWTAATGGERVTDTTVVASAGTATVYAHWVANTYTVTFDANGGLGTMPDQAFAAGEEKALTANNFVKEGAVFVGWSTTADGAMQYVNEQVVKDLPTNEVGNVSRLYAVWSDTYLVHFEGNGATDGATDDQRFTRGEEVNLSSNGFTRVGYSFRGWSTDPDGEVEYTDRAIISSADLASGDTLTLYAVWADRPYYVRFEPNGGIGTMNDQTLLRDAEEALAENVFEKTGYTFANWQDSLHGSGETYANGEVVKNLAEEGQTKTLVATWVANTYTVLYSANGGMGTMAPQEAVYDEPFKLRDCTYTRAGYAFVGWATEPTGTVVYVDKSVDTVSNLTAEPNGKVRLFAQWVLSTKSNGNVFSIAADCDCDTTDRKAVVLTPTDMPHCFSVASNVVDVGGNGQYIVVTNTVALTVKSVQAILTGRGTLSFWYKVFLPENEEDEDLGVFTFIFHDKKEECKELARHSVSTWTKYTWKKEYDTSDSIEWRIENSADEDNGYLLLDNIRWVPDDFSTTIGATFRRNDGTATPNDIVTNATLVVNEVVTNWPALTREGYVFKGWALEPTTNLSKCVYTVAGGSTYKPTTTNDITFYAVWAEGASNADDGSEPCANDLVDDATRDEIDESEADLSAASVFDGYLSDGDALTGTIQIKLGKGSAKTGTAKLTATVVFADGTSKTTVSGTFDPDAESFTGTARNGTSVELVIGADAFYGTFGDYEVVGTRNRYSSKDTADKQVVADATAVTLGSYAIVSQTAAGLDTFTVTVAKKGKVTVKGTLQDGSSISVTSQMILGEDCACVPVVYAKKNLAFLVWFDYDEESASAALAVTGLGDEAVIGTVGNLAGESVFMFEDLTAFEAAVESKLACELQTDYLPDFAAVNPSGTKWIVMPDENGRAMSAGKVVWTNGALNETKSKIEGYNVSNLKLTFTAKTGAFKGSFKVYYTVNDGAKLKTVTASVTGVVIGGVGYGTATIKNVGTFAVEIE